MPATVNLVGKDLGVEVMDPEVWDVALRRGYPGGDDPGEKGENRELHCDDIVFRRVGCDEDSLGLIPVKGQTVYPDTLPGAFYKHTGVDLVLYTARPAVSPSAS